MTQLSVHADQWIGAREKQEDAFAVLPVRNGDGSIHYGLVVADGMGGHAAGEEASRIVTEIFKSALTDSLGPPKQLLRDALNEANDRIAAAIHDNPGLAGMGTTLIAVMTDGSDIAWISVGDSLLYLYRNGRLHRLNADHSMTEVFNNLVDLGRMTADEAMNSPERHVLRSSVSGEDIPLVDLTIKDNLLRTGDILLLASDGIETLSQPEIGRILRKHHNGDATSLVAHLIEGVRAAANNSQDNVSIVGCIVLPTGIYEKTNTFLSNWFGRFFDRS